MHKSPAHTDVIRDSSHVSYPLNPARSILWRRFPASVSTTCRITPSICVPDTHFVPRIALSGFRSASRTLPSLCRGSEIIRNAASPQLILVLTIHCVTNRQPLVSVQHKAIPMPQLLQPVGKQWHRSQVTNCCSQRPFVDKCRMVPTPSRLHMLPHCPARVRSELPVP